MKTNDLVLLTIEKMIDENGFAPTVREIGKAINISSTSTIWGHLDRLKKRKLINYIPQSPRTITITKEGTDILKILNSSK
ncbi:hypothetical protein [Enterococcus devriesei]|uniref:LexA family protein n=1 Tax=Enterococcus devriesei TaxID=319970 RepID=UPI0028E3B1DC|nr:hypothetical protein [Enterococcus devriesei]